MIMAHLALSQTNPAITSWLINNVGTGTYYVQGNSTPIDNGVLYNTQAVCYSNDFAYITATGIPAYPTGPFIGNPSNAQNQNAIFKMPLFPEEEIGTKTPTTPGRIGVLINGVSIFDFRDGVAWNSDTNALCGGPGNPPCPGGPGATQAWMRDAVWAEMQSFDCSKAHPANGNYHHHQNPSAFKLDLTVLSDICNLYDSDGLYAINSAQHSPLIGFAYDGFPIYGAYGYANADGTGGVARMKSGYQLRNITERTHHADGTDVDDGPDVDATYFLGYFREDYEWISHPGEEDYLDEHNGRFCVTPEYPGGTYAYFATVDENWNSFYPYVVGPTFYGEYENRLVSSIDESCTPYDQVVPLTWGYFDAIKMQDYVALNWSSLSEENCAYYVIERSEDGRNFEHVDELIAEGNSIDESQYEYQDFTSLEMDLYYRIISVDWDGTKNFSRIAVVHANAVDGLNAHVFPNPASEFISIQMSGLVKHDVNISLFDMQGRELRRTVIKAGSTINYLETNTLYDGQYILYLSNGIESRTEKILIKH